jgi:hypothetical protein
MLWRSGGGGVDALRGGGGLMRSVWDKVLFARVDTNGVGSKVMA